MMSKQSISQTEPKIYLKNLKENRKCCFLSRSRSSNIYILIAIAFISSKRAHCKSVEEESASTATKQWHEKYSQSNNIRSEDKWIPLRDFKSPLVHSLETMKTSETLMQPMNILSSLSRAQRQQAIQMQQQPQLLNQLAANPSAAASQELESSKVDLGILMASCSQLAEREAQRQCQESYHQLQDLNSQPADHNHNHHLSLNIQGGFKPSKAYQAQQHPPIQREQAQQVAQQHLDTSASVLNTMKAPNLYHKRSSPFVPSEAIHSALRSNSEHASNNYHHNNDNTGAESVGSNYGDDNSDENEERYADGYHTNRLHRFSNGDLNGVDSGGSTADDQDSSAAANFAASNSLDASSVAPRARRLPLIRQNQLNDQIRQPSLNNNNNESNDEDPGAAERSEQEAAEASEAEAADRAALDEQQQAQQEIIKAQAASEAKAIKEQQEALMMQQRLHQQIVLRRQHDLANNQSGDRNRAGREGSFRENSFMNGGANRNGYRQQQQHNYRERQYNDEDAIDGGEESRPNKQQQEILKSSQATISHRKQLNTVQSASKKTPSSDLDIQFSDQPDNNGRLEMSSRAAETSNHDENQDEVGDYSTRRASISSPTNINQATSGQIYEPEYTSTIVGQQVAKVITSTNQSNYRSDLQPAEQHQYGSHYDSLKGHQSKYYQFAESKKKGHFDSGFKRGNKKFQISGHSSQHKSHAEGHVKWHGKKGKGVQYWNYKHSDHKKKKHHY